MGINLDKYIYNNNIIIVVHIIVLEVVVKQKDHGLILKIF